MVELNELRPVRIALVVDVNVLGETAIPVSYTHLDVYKRQGPCLQGAADNEFLAYERTS